MSTQTDDYTAVTVTNNEDQEIGLSFPNTELGQSQILTLQRRAQRGELKEVEVGKTSKGPKYPASAAPERRRGRPVEGQVEAVAVVAISENPADHDAEKLAAAEAESKAKLREAEAAGETVNTAPGPQPAKAAAKATKARKRS